MQISSAFVALANLRYINALNNNNNNQGFAWGRKNGNAVGLTSVLGRGQLVQSYIVLCWLCWQKLPGKLFELRELSRVDVSFNQLSVLDDFAELTALRHLVAVHNQVDRPNHTHSLPAS